jgi:hypothetical protein
VHAAQHAQRERGPPWIVEVTVEHGSGGTAGDQVSGRTAEQASVERAAERLARQRLPLEPPRGPLDQRQSHGLIHWKHLRL